MAFATYLAAVCTLGFVILIFMEVRDIQRTLSRIEKKLKENDK